MIYSDDFLHNAFKKCYEEAMEASGAGKMQLAKRKLGEAAEYMDKLAMTASAESRQKYAKNAERIRQLAHSIQLPKTNNGDNMGKLDEAVHEDIDVNGSEFIEILRKDELTFGFEGVTGLDSAKRAVTEYIINPVRYPKAYNYNFLDNQAILLEGPPGTGKTTFAKAVAKEIDVPFALVKVGALVNYYIGVTGKNIDRIFSYLRDYSQRLGSPVIVFLDEFDEVAKRRGGDDKVSEAAVPALLRNLDGVESNKNLFIIANTNCAGLLDAAIAERFRRIIHIPLPNAAARKELFIAKLGDVEQEFIDEINFESAAELSESLSGRDITFICDDFKRVLSKIKAKIIQQQDLNCVLYELIEERQNTKIKSE